MLCNTPASLESTHALPARQLSLFPWDPWGSEQVTYVVDQPHPGIARAMIGPIVLGAVQPFDGRIRCVAICEDCAFTASTWISQEQLNTPQTLWPVVVQRLAWARQRPVPVANPSWRPTADDCFKIWSSPQFWLPGSGQGDPVHPAVLAISKLMDRHALGLQSPHACRDMVGLEAQAQILVNEQICACLGYLFGALRTDLSDVLIHRPRLSISIAQQLIMLATQHSPTAATYALQALRTESFGLIHLATNGQPEREAREVREAIFSGRSLPTALREFGVAKALHRQTIRSPDIASTPDLRWSDLPIAGQDWLTAMRLTSFLPVPSKENWLEFSSLVNRILDLRLRRTSTAETAVQWCIRGGWAHSCDRLQQLLEHAQAFRAAAKGWAGMDLPFDESIAITLELDQAQAGQAILGPGLTGYLDAARLHPLALGVAHVSGKSVQQLLQPLFKLHPGVPAEFVAPHHITVQALNQMKHALSHGAECGNCLQGPTMVVRYIADGIALYGVRSDVGVVGTIALQRDDTNEYPVVQVLEVSGVENEAAGFDLCQLAQRLAEASNTPLQLEAWIAFESQYSQWLDLAKQRGD